MVDFPKDLQQAETIPHFSKTIKRPGYRVNFEPDKSQLKQALKLIEKAKLYDLKEVCIQGEIIGDIFIKKDFCWVNISDGINAMGIWIPKKMAEQFSHTGDYNHRGDKVRITGKFYRTCKEHTGEIDIHAEDIVFLRKGRNVSHPVNRPRAITALILFFFAFVFFILEIYLDRKIKKNGLES